MSFEDETSKEPVSDATTRNNEMEQGNIRTEKLREVFRMLDVNSTGSITVVEFGVWLACDSSTVSFGSLSAAVDAKADISADKIVFNQFEQLCDELGVAVDLTSVTSEDKKFDDLAHQMMSPLWMIMEDSNRKAAAAGKERVHAPARIQIAKAIDSNWMHGLLLFLIVIDAFAIWGEIVLFGASCETESAHNWEHKLHVVSLSILWLMGLHIVATMAVYLLMFFKNVFYVADLIIIGVALVMESIQVELGALVQVLLAWRILRIVHGIWLTYEMHHHFADLSSEQTKDGKADE